MNHIAREASIGSDKFIDAYNAPERRSDFFEVRNRRLGALATAAEVLGEIDEALAVAAPPEIPPPKPRHSEEELLNV